MAYCKTFFFFFPFWFFYNLNTEWSVGRSDDWQLLCFLYPTILGDEVGQIFSSPLRGREASKYSIGQRQIWRSLQPGHLSLSHSGLFLVLFRGYPGNKALPQHQQMREEQQIQDGKPVMKETFLQRALLMPFAPHSWAWPRYSWMCHYPHHGHLVAKCFRDHMNILYIEKGRLRII